jgi:two-component system sensor histidine kinase DesK
MRNQELSEARAELAQMAVARERERFARDLHDLLGHSLSVITLKAELAGRMLNDRPFDAAREISELEQVARTALGEVRDAVSGYRQPTLDRELAGARMALSAAGIEADIHEAHVPLDPPIEAVLAWAVREGATNVIRHSRARHCTLQVTSSLSDAGVEVIDDGVGTGAGGGTTNGVGTVIGGGRSSTPGVGTETRARAGAVSHLSADGASGGHGLAAGGGSGGHGLAAGGGSGGHGLAGLAERARLVNGTLEAGALASGGYRLAVTVPVSHR